MPVLVVAELSESPHDTMNTKVAAMANNKLRVFMKPCILKARLSKDDVSKQEMRQFWIAQGTFDENNGIVCGESNAVKSKIDHFLVGRDNFR